MRFPWVITKELTKGESVSFLPFNRQSCGYIEFIIESQRKLRLTVLLDSLYVPAAPSQAPCARPQQLALSRHRGRELELVLLRIRSQSDMDGEGRECTGSGEQNHCDEEKHADC
jgi:hypothetical protein